MTGKIVGQYVVDKMEFGDLLSHIPRWVKDVFSLFWDLHALGAVLSELKAQGQFFLSIEGSSVNARCVGSAFLSGVNYLFFRAESDSFIFSQGNSALAWVYHFESGFLYKKLPQDFSGELGRVLGWCAENGVDDAFFNREAARFDGFYLGHPRPFHYFYDHLSAFYELNSYYPGLLRDLDFYGQAEDCFINVSHLVGGGVVCKKVEPALLNKYLFNAGGFIFRVVRGANQSFDNYGFRRFILNYVEEKVSGDEALSRQLSSLDGEVVIWFGVCAEKRSWYQQKEAFQSILDKLCLQGRSVTLLFDGLTAPEGKAECDFSRGESSDYEYVGSLAESLNFDGKYINMAGLSAWKKVAFANKVTAFLANCATDSMYPAKISCKSGVGFSASIMRTSQHTHVRTLKIPKSWVFDDLAEGLNEAKVSFNIDPERVSNLFCSLLEAVKPSVLKVKSKSCLGSEGEGYKFLISSNDLLSFPVDVNCFSESGLAAVGSVLLLEDQKLDLRVEVEGQLGVDVWLECVEKLMSGVSRKRVFRIDRYYTIDGVETKSLSSFKLSARGRGEFLFFGVSAVFH